MPFMYREYIWRGYMIWDDSWPKKRFWGILESMKIGNEKRNNFRYKNRVSNHFVMEEVTIDFLHNTGQENSRIG